MNTEFTLARPLFTGKWNEFCLFKPEGLFVEEELFSRDDVEKFTRKKYQILHTDESSVIFSCCYLTLGVAQKIAAFSTCFFDHYSDYSRVPDLKITFYTDGMGHLGTIKTISVYDLREIEIRKNLNKIFVPGLENIIISYLTGKAPTAASALIEASGSKMGNKNKRSINSNQQELQKKSQAKRRLFKVEEDEDDVQIPTQSKFPCLKP